MSSIRGLIRHPEFRRGVREMVEPSLGIAAWAFVTGVAMVNAGLSVPLAVAMTVLVYAGSAQLAALPLLVMGAPLWIVWATAFCVNLRFVIYSAHWARYFGHLPRWQRLVLGYFAVDVTYALFVRRFPTPQPSPEHLPYFWGGAAWNWGSWVGASLFGVFIADREPTNDERSRALEHTIVAKHY